MRLLKYFFLLVLLQINSYTISYASGSDSSFSREIIEFCKNKNECSVRPQAISFPTSYGSKKTIKIAHTNECFLKFKANKKFKKALKLLIIEAKLKNMVIVINSDKIIDYLKELDIPQDVSDAFSLAESDDNFQSEMSCSICWENAKNITFEPCGHMSVCESCSVSITSCPICRKKITKKIKTFY